MPWGEPSSLCLSMGGFLKKGLGFVLDLRIAKVGAYDFFGYICTNLQMITGDSGTRSWTPLEGHSHARHTELRGCLRLWQGQQWHGSSFELSISACYLKLDAAKLLSWQSLGILLIVAVQLASVEGSTLETSQLITVFAESCEDRDGLAPVGEIQKRYLVGQLSVAYR